MTAPTVVEICAGGGGQALGLEQAGFTHVAAIEIEADACQTLTLNRPDWNVMQADIRNVNGRQFAGVDLLAGGVPCTPFSVAGGQLGEADERNLFPTALAMVREARPRAVMLENVLGLAEQRFTEWRRFIRAELDLLGYSVTWQVIHASDHGVPQLRPRFVLTGIHRDAGRRITWPGTDGPAPTVGEAIGDLMAAGGWPGAVEWAAKASKIAPTLVGGSRKHGGPDLGPTRARAAWAELGVNGRSLANEAPGPDGPGWPIWMPRLTLRMCARLQGFPDDWLFAGKKTAAYRQIGNAFPPPVAKALGEAIRDALETGERGTAA